MRRFRVLFKFRTNLRHLNQEAAFDSLRNVLAVLGLGVLIGDFATMHLMYVVPGAALLIAVWYADYLRHDLPPAVDVQESVPEKKPNQIEPMNELGTNQLGRAS